MNVYYLNVTLIGKKLQRDHERTECEHSQFGSSRERIAAANAENPQCNTTENVERAAEADLRQKVSSATSQKGLHGSTYDACRGAAGVEKMA